MLALQKAIVARLKAEATGAGNNVFDRVPESNPFPRITIGEGQTLPDNSDCRRGSDVTLEIHVWSREVGWPEAKAITDEVREALDDPFPMTLDGHILDLLDFADARFLRDPDGITSHVAMSFRALTQPYISPPTNPEAVGAAPGLGAASGLSPTITVSAGAAAGTGAALAVGAALSATGSGLASGIGAAAAVGSVGSSGAGAMQFNLPAQSGLIALLEDV